MSRNMELLSVLSVHPANHDQFETVTITYPTSGGNVTKVFLIVSVEPEERGGPSPIRLLDVTDPRNVDKNGFLDIRSFGYGVSSYEGNVPFEQYQVYKAPGTPGSETYNGDVFLIAFAPPHKPGGSDAQIRVSDGPVYARFFDL